MESYFSPDLHELKRARDNYLVAIQPYVDMLAKIHALKPVRFVMNLSTGESVEYYGPDSKVEIEIKKEIASIEEMILGPFKTKMP